MNKKLLFVAIPLVILLLVPAGYFYMKYQKATMELKKMSPENSKQEVQSLLAKVGKLMELPKDEEPTVATIVDKEKLKGQKFFEAADNDDKVIIFVKSQKAILYRPSINKVIDVTHIDTMDQVGDTASKSGEVVKPSPAMNRVMVAIYNGTEKMGLSGNYATKLSGESDIEVVARKNAVKKDYAKTFVVDLSGKYSTVVDRLSKSLGAPSTKIMPEGEATPSADILVVLGEDYK